MSKLISCAVLLALAAACDPTVMTLPDPSPSELDPGVPIAARKIAGASVDALRPGLTVTHDTDADGLTDAETVDLNDDGVTDIIVLGVHSWHDTDRNGSWDTVLHDNDGDGQAESAETDIDDDGDFDYGWVDHNRDGFVDEGEIHRLPSPIPYTCPAAIAGLDRTTPPVDPGQEQAWELLQAAAGIEPDEGEAVQHDTDQDRVTDVVTIDLNGDGRWEIIQSGDEFWYDLDGNGVWEVVLYEHDGDPDFESGRIDLDQDGDHDQRWYDEDDDGEVELEEISPFSRPVPYTCPTNGLGRMTTGG